MSQKRKAVAAALTARITAMAERVFDDGTAVVIASSRFRDGA
jgi:hypothetical protein